jgi:hypothetical protein
MSNDTRCGRGSRMSVSRSNANFKSSQAAKTRPNARKEIRRLTAELQPLRQFISPSHSSHNNDFVDCDLNQPIAATGSKSLPRALQNAPTFDSSKFPARDLEATACREYKLKASRSRLKANEASVLIPSDATRRGQPTLSYLRLMARGRTQPERHIFGRLASTSGMGLESLWPFQARRSVDTEGSN